MANDDKKTSAKAPGPAEPTQAPPAATEPKAPADSQPAATNTAAATKKDSTSEPKPNPFAHLTLPTQPREILNDINRTTLFIFGPNRSGKTTFASKAPKPLFICTEPGTDFIETMDIRVHNWPEFEYVVKVLLPAKRAEAKKAGLPAPYLTVVIDTVNRLYEFCSEFVCKEHGVKSPSDKAYGRVWGDINVKFREIMTYLIDRPEGLILISHAKDKIVKINGGEKTFYEPYLSTGGRQIIGELAHIIGYAYTTRVLDDKKEWTGEMAHFLRLSPHPDVPFLGSRVKHLPSDIPLSYAHLVAAFYKTTLEKATEWIEKKQSA